MTQEPNDHTDQPVTPDYDKTCDEVLEESIWGLLELGYTHGLTVDDVDVVLRKVIDRRAEARRDAFKVHEGGVEGD